ncbi:MAG: RES family NAD+ phosphorylase [Thiohalocapsa sp.]
MRMVESQQQVATLSLVDDLGEQRLLEEMLESTKPAPRRGSDRLHYLLAAPFRYPPLRHGSRFGSRFEPALFYGAHRLTTALAEVAYYRLAFFTAMTEPPPSGRLRTQHSLFSARWHTTHGVRLQTPPCDAHGHLLRHPADYGATQRLGRAMRDAGIGAFEYPSARDLAAGINIGLFDPDSLLSREPIKPRSWLCETRADGVDFAAAANRELQHFPLRNFLLDGRLPRPV